MGTLLINFDRLEFFNMHLNPSIWASLHFAPIEMWPLQMPLNPGTRVQLRNARHWVTVAGLGKGRHLWKRKECSFGALHFILKFAFITFSMKFSVHKALFTCRARPCAIFPPWSAFICTLWWRTNKVAIKQGSCGCHVFILLSANALGVSTNKRQRERWTLSL